MYLAGGQIAASAGYHDEILVVIVVIIEVSIAVVICIPLGAPLPVAAVVPVAPVVVFAVAAAHFTLAQAAAVATNDGEIVVAVIVIIEISGAVIVGFLAGIPFPIAALIPVIPVIIPVIAVIIVIIIAVITIIIALIAPLVEDIAAAGGLAGIRYTVTAVNALRRKNAVGAVIVIEIHIIPVRGASPARVCIGTVSCRAAGGIACAADDGIRGSHAVVGAVNICAAQRAGAAGCHIICIGSQVFNSCAVANTDA